MKKLTHKEVKKLQLGDPVVTNMGAATYKEYCKKTYAHKVILANGEPKNVYSLYADS